MRTYANILGEDEAASLLEETLEEEKETDQKLTQLAEQINVQAAGEGDEGEEEEGEEATSGSRAGNSRSAAKGRENRGSPRLAGPTVHFHQLTSINKKASNRRRFGAFFFSSRLSRKRKRSDTILPPMV